MAPGAQKKLAVEVGDASQAGKQVQLRRHHLRSSRSKGVGSGYIEELLGCNGQEFLAGHKSGTLEVVRVP